MIFHSTLKNQVTRCIICESNHFSIISDKVRGGINQNVVICHKCGFVFLHPLELSNNEYAKHYEESYYKKKEFDLTPNEKRKSLQKKRGRFIVSFVKGHFILDQNTRILEVGCGSGGIINEFSKYGCYLTGIEPSPLWNSHLNSLGCIKVVNVTLEDYLSPKKFNLIILSHVFEHFINLDMVCRKLKSLLNVHGLIYIEVPDIHNIKLSRKLHNSFFRLEHISYFSLNSLKSLLIKYNFNILRTELSENVIKILVNLSPQSNDSYVLKKDVFQTISKIYYYRFLRFPIHKFFYLMKKLIIDSKAYNKFRGFLWSFKEII